MSRLPTLSEERKKVESLVAKLVHIRSKAQYVLMSGKYKDAHMKNIDGSAADCIDILRDLGIDVDEYAINRK